MLLAAARRSSCLSLRMDLRRRAFGLRSRAPTLFAEAAESAALTNRT
ncbi:hypothetical protein FM112_06975 [Gulosibacter sp. 10]|nr:hypothetical protein FM112_06975 [Gulosibacter sp. 10]